MSSASGNAKLKLPLHLKNEDFYFPIVDEADNEYDEEYDPDQVEHYNRRYTFQNISIHGDHVFLRRSFYEAKTKNLAKSLRIANGADR